MSARQFLCTRRWYEGLLFHTRYPSERFVPTFNSWRGKKLKIFFLDFSEELQKLFESSGFIQEANLIDRRLQVNRGKMLKMYRVWVQAKYRKPLENWSLKNYTRLIFSKMRKISFRNKTQYDWNNYYQFIYTFLWNKRFLGICLIFFLVNSVSWIITSLKWTIEPNAFFIKIYSKKNYKRLNWSVNGNQWEASL